MALLLASGACSVPNHMHVTRGVSPKYVDMNVRFRATYYFRTFDFCWARDATTGKLYQSAIPETDVLYRYRMTGKASALANKINFESAVVDAKQIDPFGAKLGIYDKSAQEVPPRTPATEESTSAPAASSGFALALSDPPVSAPTSASSPTPLAAQEAKDTEATFKAMLEDCAHGKVERGFMLMGPEGMTQFNQSKRLVLAMTSSADPLIETLQEYAGRVLSADQDPTAGLIPLVQEGRRTREALSALEKTPAEGDAKTIAAAVLTAFGTVEPAQ